MGPQPIYEKCDFWKNCNPTSAGRGTADYVECHMRLAPNRCPWCLGKIKWKRRKSDERIFGRKIRGDVGVFAYPPMVITSGPSANPSYWTTTTNFLYDLYVGPDYHMDWFSCSQLKGKRVKRIPMKSHFLSYVGQSTGPMCTKFSMGLPWNIANVPDMSVCGIPQKWRFSTACPLSHVLRKKGAWPERHPSHLDTVQPIFTKFKLKLQSAHSNNLSSFLGSKPPNGTTGHFWKNVIFVKPFP